MERRYLTLNDISAYKISLQLSNYVWNVVSKWDFFKKKTVGEQFVRSIDSISANIAEEFGRYHKKDKIHFYEISYGSVTESLDWSEKAKTRTLLSNDEYNYVYQELTKLPREINHLIHFTNEKLSI